MSSIARMAPKPSSSCGYMSRKSPQPIAQNRVFKIERPEPPPFNLNNYVVHVENVFRSFLNRV